MAEQKKYRIDVIDDGIPKDEMLKLIARLPVMSIRFSIVVEADSELDAAAKVRADGLWIDDVYDVSGEMLAEYHTSDELNGTA